MEYKIININDWTQTGEGGTATSYFHKNDENIMVKLFSANVTKYNYAIREFEFANNVIKLGISTPKAIELVKTGDGLTGVIYERIKNKISFSRLCADNPNDIEKYATIFATELKKIHNTKCDTSFFTSIRDIVIKSINNNKIFSKNIKNKILDFVNEIGDTDTCIHGDPHSGNIVDSNGKLSWIDLGAFGYGSPWYDIGGVYFFYIDFIGIQFSKKLLHMNKNQLKRFYKQFVYTYADCKTEDDFIKFTEKAKKAAILFAIYTMNVEHHKDIDLLFDSILIIKRVLSWK